MNTQTNTPLLSIHNLKISFKAHRKLSPIINSLDLEIHKNEIVTIIGASGSGKSLLAHCILGILPKNAITTGEIHYMGENLIPSLQKKLRGTDIVLIPQSVDFLDPLMHIDKQIIGIHGNKKLQREMFERYDLDINIEKAYPFELSGGMARRVLISSAVGSNPQLIVADEPTSGLTLDLAIKSFRHFRELANGGAAVLLITHDIDLAMHESDKIVVMHAGSTVEIAPSTDFVKGGDSLRHPYSKALINALPQNNFQPIQGHQPSLEAHKSGCLFADRCPIKTDRCDGEIPLQALRGGFVRCVNAT